MIEKLRTEITQPTENVYQVNDIMDDYGRIHTRMNRIIRAIEESEEGFKVLVIRPTYDEYGYIENSEVTREEYDSRKDLEKQLVMESL